MLFRKKYKEGVVAVATGELISLEKVNDTVFSQKNMGGGFAVIPTDGKIYSPVTGKIASIYPTKHALTINSLDGLEIMIHMGLDTVNLDGEGFTLNVKERQEVQAGDQIAFMDLDYMKNKVSSLDIIVIFFNLGNSKIELKEGNVEGGEKDRIVLIP